MKINFVGSFTTGYVGEVADEVILTNELESLGHIVQRVPRDIWKAHCDGEMNIDWLEKLPIVADINIVCKWHHFSESKYVEQLRKESGAPVFYWTWDFMDYNEDGFHYQMAKAADLLLTNDGFNRIPKEIKWHYFPFDVADGNIKREDQPVRDIDVAFFGSKLGQGDRVEWLQELNKHISVTVFSWNWRDWQKLGFSANPAVYGQDLARAVSRSKVVIGFNVNDHTWGYWSNRTGKMLTLGACLLYRYVPGMELFLGNGADYFSSKEEMVNKVQWYLDNPKDRSDLERRATEVGKRFTAKARIKDLEIVIDRYLNGGI